MLVRISHVTIAQDDIFNHLVLSNQQSKNLKIFILLSCTTKKCINLQLDLLNVFGFSAKKNDPKGLFDYHSIMFL